MIPEPIEHALRYTGTEGLPGTVALDVDCEGSAFHSPRPLTLRLVSTPAGDKWLCSTCADLLAVYLHLLAHGPQPWKVRRCFGNAVRALAQDPQEADN